MTSEPSTPDDAPAPAELPPLRIHHLMLWTAAMAVLMAVSQTWGQEQATDGVTSVLTITWNAGSAAAIVVVGLGCVWQRRGLPFFDQPGHGLAIILVLSVMHAMYWTAAYKIFSESPMAAYATTTLLAQVIALVAVWWMWRRLADSQAWRWLFFWELIQNIVGIFETFTYALAFNGGWYVYDIWRGLQFVSAILGLITGFVLIIAVVIDWRRKTPRHWTHWSMTFMAFLVGVSTWCWQFVLWYSGEF